MSLGGHLLTSGLAPAHAVFSFNSSWKMATEAKQPKIDGKNNHEGGEEQAGKYIYLHSKERFKVLTLFKRQFH